MILRAPAAARARGKRLFSTARARRAEEIPGQAGRAEEKTKEGMGAGSKAGEGEERGSFACSSLFLIERRPDVQRLI